MRSLLLALAVAALAPHPALAAAPEALKVHRLQLNPESEMPTYGTFKIFWKTGTSGWKQAGELGYDNFYRERTLDLRGVVPAGVPVRLRLVQVGGGASQLDGVRLGDQTPRGLSPAMHKKLVAADRDVVVSSGKTFTFDFDPVTAPVLALAARVEAPKIPHLQFNLPEINRLRGPETGWSFMPYTLGSRPLKLKTDGELDEVKGVKPFLHEIRTSATGHGFGDVYAWVGDDADHLYVAFDFTIDNTVEDDFYPGADDYAIVYIRYGPKPTDLQDFKLRVRDGTWGKTGFAYTDKVGYEHRTYEFRIPRAKIKALQGSEKKQLDLAFGLFGSASDGDYPVRIVYAPGRQRYLALSGWAQTWTMPEYVRAHLLDADGTPLGARFMVTGPTYALATNNYAFDAAWDAANNRFMVVWHQSDGSLRGRAVYADGTSGPTFTLATGLGAAASEIDLERGGDATWPFMVAARHTTDGTLYVLPFKADGVTAGTLAAVPRATTLWPVDVRLTAANDGTYLVTWNENYDIYARHVGADGAMLGNTELVYDSASYELAQSTAFDPERGRFLLAWRSDGNEDVHAAAFYANTNTVGTVFSLFNPGVAFRYPRPSLDYDALRKRFPLVMHLANEPVPFRYAEVNAADFGFAFGPVTTPALSKDNVSPTVVAAGDSGAAMLAWQTYANNTCCVYDYAVAVTNLPVATLSPSTLDFGTVTVGATATRDLTVTNTGATRSLLKLQASVSGPFTLSTDGCSGATLAKGASCALVVKAAPTANGVKTGVLTLTGGVSKTLALTVKGAPDGEPALVLTDPAPPATDGDLDFGYVPTGSKLVRTVRLSNEGTVDLVLGAVAGPKKASGFSVEAKTCSSKTIAPEKGCDVTITFAPTATEAYEVTVVIPSNDPDGDATLRLAGTGVAAGDLPDLTAPVLVSPVDGATGVASPATLTYRPALAADGGAVTHTVYVCEDAGFVGCEGETVAAAAPLGGGFGLVAFGLSGLGLVFFRRKAGLAALLLAGAALGSCAGGDDKRDSSIAYVTYTTGDLAPATTYHWKVVAQDNGGNITQSEVRTFTTE